MDPFAFNGSISVVGVPTAAPPPRETAVAVATAPTAPVAAKATKRPTSAAPIKAASPFSVGATSAPANSNTFVRTAAKRDKPAAAAAATAVEPVTKAATAPAEASPTRQLLAAAPVKSALKASSRVTTAADAAAVVEAASAERARKTKRSLSSSLNEDALRSAAAKLAAPVSIEDLDTRKVVKSASGGLTVADDDDATNPIKVAELEAKRARAERIKSQVEAAKAALKLRQKKVSVRETNVASDPEAAAQRLFGAPAPEAVTPFPLTTAPAQAPAVAPAAAAAAASSSSDSDDDDKDDVVVDAPSSAAAAAPRAESGPLPPEELASFLHPRLVKVLDVLHVQRLTRVQRLAWYPMIGTTDVLIRSETGSGKTLAYGLPMLHSLLSRCDVTPIDRFSTGTVIVVMTPTRELAEQCSTVLTKCLQKAAFIVVGSIHGGEDKHKEKARLRKGVNVLVCTPGRLLDHVQNTASFAHNNLHTMVLDEADRLLDMGFERTIASIMQVLKPVKRVLVSATITAAVERLSHFALKNPVRVGETEDKYDVPTSLRQHYVVVPCKHRLVALTAVLLSQLEASAKKMVVFVSTSDATEFLYLFYSRLVSPFQSGKKRFGAASGAATGMVSRHDATLAKRSGASAQKKLIRNANRHLSGDGDGDDGDFEEVSADASGNAAQVEAMVAAATKAAALSEAQKRGEATSLTGNLNDDDALLKCNVFKLHGNMNQTDRTAVFNAFRDCDRGVLFCTDVAARGLDMPSISWIIHYDPPSDDRCYIHRVGRTARIGKAGDSVLFLMEHEQGFLEYLATTTTTPLKEKSLSVFMYHLARLDSERGGGGSMWGDAAAKLQRAACNLVRHDEVLNRVAMYAYRSQVRSYATYPREVKQYFDASQLHLGHLAGAFGIDATPTEMKRQATKFSSEDRAIGRDQQRFRKQEGTQVQFDTRETYRSTLATKTARTTLDFVEAKEAAGDYYKRISSNAKAEFEA